MQSESRRLLHKEPYLQHARKSADCPAPSVHGGCGWTTVNMADRVVNYGSGSIYLLLLLFIIIIILLPQNVGAYIH